jgi:hypothetical protein
MEGSCRSYQIKPADPAWMTPADIMHIALQSRSDGLPELAGWTQNVATDMCCRDRVDASRLFEGDASVQPIMEI